MFEFFKKLFKKPTPVKSEEPISIDITGKSISVNGNKFALPTDIDKITAILGTPRVKQYDTKVSDKEFLDSMYENNSVTNRTNYMWDELGIKCYTLDGRTVTTFGIELNKGIIDYPNTTKTLFGGTVTINGMPWLPQVNAGMDLEVIRQLRLGCYTLTCEYIDFDQQPSQLTEKDYTGIEVGISKK